MARAQTSPGGKKRSPKRAKRAPKRPLATRSPRDLSIKALGFWCFRLIQTLERGKPSFSTIQLREARNAMGVFMLAK